MKLAATGLIAACFGACTIDEPETSTVDQYGMNMQGMNMQGMNMQGMNMQGMNMQGMNMQGFLLDGATLSATTSRSSNVRVERGEVVADRGGQTLRGTAARRCALHRSRRQQ